MSELDSRANTTAKQDMEIKRLADGWSSAGETWDRILADIWLALKHAGHPPDGESTPGKKIMELAERAEKAVADIQIRDHANMMLEEDCKELKAELAKERERFVHYESAVETVVGRGSTRGDIDDEFERLEREAQAQALAEGEADDE